MGETILEAHDYLRLAAEVQCDPRTVRAAYSGAKMQRAIWLAINSASERLNLPKPQKWNAPSRRCA